MLGVRFPVYGLFCFLMLASVVHADVGPSPASPEINIQLQVNGIGYDGIDWITYHCEGSNDTGMGAVDQKLVNITCVSGVCKNTNWFYKLNPCFYSSGFFSYGLDNKTIQTEMMDFTKPGKYDGFIEIESGDSAMTYKQPGVSDDLDGFCLVGFVFPVLVVVALGMRHDQ